MKRPILLLLITGACLLFAACNQTPPTLTEPGVSVLPEATAAAPSSPAETPPPQTALGQGSAEVLAKIDALFAEGDGAPKLEYFGDSGSGPTLVRGQWEQTDIDELKEVFSTYEWRKMDGPPPEIEWTEENNSPAEGGAYTIRLLNIPPSPGMPPPLSMSYGYPFLDWPTAEEPRTHYVTEGYGEFYAALERFCYRKQWPTLGSYAWRHLDNTFSGRTLTLCRPDGGLGEIVWDDVSQGVKALIESRVWVFLPEGARELDKTGKEVRLSAEYEYEELIAYDNGAYLRIPGYTYKSVDENGNPDSIYADLCKLLGAA